MKCDICGKEEVKIPTINKVYQTENIKHICCSCFSAVIDKKTSIKATDKLDLQEQVKAFMEKMRNKYV